MLNISPFSYGMKVVQVRLDAATRLTRQIFSDGNVFPPSVLDIEESELLKRFTQAITTVAALSLALKYPTLASAPHLFFNAFKNVLAVSLATDYDFEQSAALKERLANPEAFASAAPVEAAPAAADAPKAEEKPEEKEESGTCPTWRI